VRTETESGVVLVEVHFEESGGTAGAEPRRLRAGLGRRD